MRDACRAGHSHVTHLSRCERVASRGCFPSSLGIAMINGPDMNYAAGRRRRHENQLPRYIAMSCARDTSATLYCGLCNVASISVPRAQTSCERAKSAFNLHPTGVLHIIIDLGTAAR